MRQIVEALGIKPQFDIDSTPNNLNVFSMTEYKKEFPFPVVFPPVIPNNTIAEWLSGKGLPQFHCAGTHEPDDHYHMLVEFSLLFSQRRRSMLM